jgi:hypothetical protein
MKQKLRKKKENKRKNDRLSNCPLSYCPCFRGTVQNRTLSLPSILDSLYSTL